MKKIYLLFIAAAILPAFSFADDLTGNVAAQETSTGSVDTGSTLSGSTETTQTTTVDTGSDSSQQTGDITTGNTASTDEQTGSVQTTTVQTGETQSSIDTGNSQGTGLLSTINSARSEQKAAAWADVKQMHEDFMSKWGTGFSSQINQNWSDFRTKYPSSDKSWKWKYIKGADKTAIKELLAAKALSEKTAFASLHALYKIGSGDAVSGFYTPRIEGLSRYYSGLAQYVESGSIEKFNQYVSDIMTVYKTNSQLRVDRFNAYTQFYASRQNTIDTLANLPAGIADKLKAILDKIPDSQKENTLNKVIAIIDQKIEKIESSDADESAKQRNVGYLNGLNSIVQGYLDSLTLSDSDQTTTLSE